MQVLALGSLTPSLQSLRLAYIRVSRMFRTHYHRDSELYTHNAISSIRAFVYMAFGTTGTRFIKSRFTRDALNPRWREIQRRSI